MTLSPESLRTSSTLARRASVSSVMRLRVLKRCWKIIKISLARDGGTGKVWGGYGIWEFLMRAEKPTESKKATTQMAPVAWRSRVKKVLVAERIVMRPATGRKALNQLRFINP